MTIYCETCSLIHDEDNCKNMENLTYMELDLKYNILKTLLSEALGFIGVAKDESIVQRVKNSRKNETNMENIKEYLVSEYGGWNGDESGIGEDNAQTVEEIISLLDSLQGSN